MRRIKPTTMIYQKIDSRQKHTGMTFLRGSGGLVDTMQCTLLIAAYKRLITNLNIQALRQIIPEMSRHILAINILGNSDRFPGFIV